ncbi:MAG: amidohydrolase family protein [Armatimonadota bacterium]|nr:amidohydrolase family protein [Armatimonadota bacterium]
MAKFSKKKLRKRLLEEMESIRTVDCHSHTALRREYYQKGPRDLFSLLSYFDREVQAATGHTLAQLCGQVATDEERWRILKSVVARAGNTSYWRHHLVTYQGLFGLKEAELTDENWREVNLAIRNRTADPQWYDYVTKKVCSLETQVRNVPWFEDWEPDVFTATLRMEPALQLHQPEPRGRLEEYLGCSLVDLPSLKQGIAALVDSYRQRGAVGIKLAHAYSRTLATDVVPEEDAARIFAASLAGQTPSPAEVKALQDHLIHYLADLCAEMNLVFQIHTGVQTTWGRIPESDPLLLLPLIHAHRSTRFDLFHAGYPYSREMGMLGKHCPNVWLNMAWMYLVTMEGSRQTLSEWIDLVPGDRILGFGSDVGWPEMIYGHLTMARACIADVLVEKVWRDFLSEEAAHSLARMMLRDNAMKLYGLS